ncbi:hypothetical protein B0H14DRAFT_2340905, partial [Mycena olivaceomarginata]
STKYPPSIADPHASRVIRYMRPATTEPGSIYRRHSGRVLAWGWKGIDRTGFRMRPCTTVGALGLGFSAGASLIAYSRSSMRFWGWTENAREEARDVAELSQLAREGKPLYGESLPAAVGPGAAHRNSHTPSSNSVPLFPMLHLVHHPFHDTDPAKYGVQAEPAVLQNEEGLRPGEMLQRKFDLKGTLKPDTDKDMEP